MQPWAPVDVPHLQGGGPPLRLYDTATRQIRPTAPGATALMYVCGITPYDATHLGHAATYLAFDLVNRLWRDLGHDVTYVQNITVANLDDSGVVQLTLPFDRNSQSALDATLDDVRARFGSDAITRAVLLHRDQGLSVPLLPD